MINIIIELIDKDVIFTKEDGINIFAEAISILTAEHKHNFNLEVHNTNKSHTGIDKGCGCYYCELRHKLRNTQLYKAKVKSNYNSFYRNIGRADRANYIKTLNELKARIREIKQEKYLVKRELNLI